MLFSSFCSAAPVQNPRANADELFLEPQIHCPRNHIPHHPYLTVRHLYKNSLSFFGTFVTPPMRIKSPLRAFFPFVMSAFVLSGVLYLKAAWASRVGAACQSRAPSKAVCCSFYHLQRTTFHSDRGFSRECCRPLGSTISERLPLLDPPFSPPQ